MYRLYYDEDYRIAVNKENRNFTMKCTVDDKVIDNSKISSFVWETDLVNGNSEYSIGNLSSTKLTVVFSSDVEIQENSKVAIETTIPVYVEELGFEVPQTINQGVYYVNSITEKQLSKTVVAYNKLYHEILTRRYVSNLEYKTTYGSGKAIPISDVIKELCSLRYLDIDYYDISDYKLSLQRPDVVTEKIINEEGKSVVVETDSMQVCLGMTVGQALSCIASYLGGNFIITGDNYLDFVKLRNTSDFTYDASKYKIDSSGPSVYQLKRIDCTVYEGSVISAGNGDESSAMKLENPFIRMDRLQYILEDLSTINYSPIKIRVKGDPTIEVGDMIKLFPLKSEDSTILFPALRVTMNYSGAFFCDIEAFCLTTSEKSYEYKGTLSQRIDNLNTVVDSVSSEIDRINSSLSALSTVKDYVNDIDRYIDTLSTELTASKKFQYETLLNNILTSDSEFNSRYSAVMASKYLS